MGPAPATTQLSVSTIPLIAALRRRHPRFQTTQKPDAHDCLFGIIGLLFKGVLDNYEAPALCAPIEQV
jgi:hypothetical protein